MRSLVPLILSLMLGCEPTAGPHGRTVDTVADAPASPFPPGTGVVFSVSDAPSMFGNQCQPQVLGIESYWMPSDVHILHLEIELAPALATRLLEVRPVHRADATANDYLRQYAGIIRSGRREIYVIGIHRHLYELISAPLGKFSTQVNDELLRRRPLVICDSGRDQFWVTFDVQDHDLGRIEFQGSL